MRVKVKFMLDDSPDGAEAEWMWAKRKWTGFLLDNSPFSTYGISYMDLFSAKKLDGVLVFDKIIKKGGHRTLRVRLAVGKSHQDFAAIWGRLEDIGCTFEGSQIGRPQYAIDVPPEANIKDAIAYLAQLEAAGALEYEEADCFSLAVPNPAVE